MKRRRFRARPQHDIGRSDRRAVAATLSAPASAALGNPVADAAGARIRGLPLSPERVKAEIGV